MVARLHKNKTQRFLHSSKELCCSNFLIIYATTREDHLFPYHCVAMTPDCLCSLSPELMCLILQEINSTRDFYSLIRASAQVYSAFLPLRAPMLSCLLKRALSSEVLHHDARITLRSSQFPFHQSMKVSEHSEASEAFLRFISDVDKTDFAHKVIPLDLSVPLCKFQSASNT